MSKIAINISLQQEHFEIDISGNAAGFANLTDYLSRSPTGVFPLKSSPNTYFPMSIKILSTKLVEQSKGLVTAQVSDAELRLMGDPKAFLKLGAFLESLQNLSPGEHFHLDWFSNEDLLAPNTSNMSFIFSIES